MEWSIFEREHPGVKVEEKQFDEIPYLSFVPKSGQGERPTVIYYHGWHSSKEFKRFEAMLIASFGYRVIVPDALYHGERGIVDYDAPGSIDRYLWEIIFQSVEESERFISHLEEAYGIQAEQVFVMGSSMGAMIAAGVFSKNPRIKGLASVSGLLAWEKALKQGAMPEAGAYAELIQQYDLHRNPERMQKRPVLILHGVEDNALPIELQREFYQAAKGEYSQVEMVEYDQVGHRFSMNMMQKLMMWLDEK